MYIYIYIYINIHIHIHLHIRICIYIYIYTHTLLRLNQHTRTWLLTNEVNTNGAAAKVITNSVRLGKMVCPGTFGKIKVG